jgi:hypothetical protein
VIFKPVYWILHDPSGTQDTGCWNVCFLKIPNFSHFLLCIHYRHTFVLSLCNKVLNHSNRSCRLICSFPWSWCKWCNIITCMRLKIQVCWDVTLCSGNYSPNQRIVTSQQTWIFGNTAVSTSHLTCPRLSHSTVWKGNINSAFNICDSKMYSSLTQCDLKFQCFYYYSFCSKNVTVLPHIVNYTLVSFWHVNVIKFFRMILIFLYDFYANRVMITDWCPHITNVTNLCSSSLNNQLSISHIFQIWLRTLWRLTEM